MELLAEIFEELAANAHFAPARLGLDRRASARAMIHLPVTVVRLNGDKNAKPMPAIIRDLSAHGMCIEYTEPIHVNAPFAVRVQRRDGSPLWIHCESVRWSPLGGKQFTIGARFTGVFTPPQP